MKFYFLMAVLVLLLHTLWNLWVVLGWMATHNRPFLRWLHIISVLYSIVAMAISWPCPLTVAERNFEQLAGVQPFSQPFVIQYLRILVSPNLPKGFVAACAELVCISILLHYAVRYHRREIAGR